MADRRNRGGSFNSPGRSAAETSSFLQSIAAGASLAPVEAQHINSELEVDIQMHPRFHRFLAIVERNRFRSSFTSEGSVIPCSLIISLRRFLRPENPPAAGITANSTRSSKVWCDIPLTANSLR